MKMTESTLVAQGGDPNLSRKASKPMIEKRRRARINSSLMLLKEMVVGKEQQQKNANGRTPKLEKADILDITVKFLRDKFLEQQNGDIQEQHYNKGFNQCFEQVCEFLECHHPGLKESFIAHMNNLHFNPNIPSEVSSVNMDDNSCSSGGRSLTPASIGVESPSMEYSSTSPFTDAESEASGSSSCLLRTLSCRSPSPSVTRPSDDGIMEAANANAEPESSFCTSYSMDTDSKPSTPLADIESNEIREKTNAFEGKIVPLDLAKNIPIQSNVNNGEQWGSASSSSQVNNDGLNLFFRPWKK